MALVTLFNDLALSSSCRSQNMCNDIVCRGSILYVVVPVCFLRHVLCWGTLDSWFLRKEGFRCHVYGKGCLFWLSGDDVAQQVSNVCLAIAAQKRPEGGLRMHGLSGVCFFLASIRIIGHYMLILSWITLICNHGTVSFKKTVLVHPLALTKTIKFRYVTLICQKYHSVVLQLTFQWVSEAPLLDLK